MSNPQRAAHRDVIHLGRIDQIGEPRRFHGLTGVGQREAGALLAERFKGRLRFAPGGAAG
jgi:hypothetical protein